MLSLSIPHAPVHHKHVLGNTEPHDAPESVYMWRAGFKAALFNWWPVGQIRPFTDLKSVQLIMKSEKQSGENH